MFSKNLKWIQRGWAFFNILIKNWPNLCYLKISLKNFSLLCWEISRNFYREKSGYFAEKFLVILPGKFWLFARKFLVTLLRNFSLFYREKSGYFAGKFLVTLPGNFSLLCFEISRYFTRKNLVTLLGNFSLLFREICRFFAGKFHVIFPGKVWLLCREI